MSAEQSVLAESAASGSAEGIVDDLRRYLAQLSDGKLSCHGVRLDDLDPGERFTSLTALASHLKAQRA